MGKLSDWIGALSQTLTRIGEDVKALRDTKENISNKVTSLDIPSDTTYPTTKAVVDAILDIDHSTDSMKVVAINETAMFYTPTGRGNILYASVGSYYIPKTTADSRVIYRGDARWSIETGQGLSGNQILIIEPEYGDLVLASVKIPIDSVKEYSLEFDYQLEFRGDSQSNVIISGIVKVFSESKKTFSANIIGIDYSTKIPNIGDRIFKITAETDSVDRIYGALGGSLIKIYSEEEGGDDPDPPPGFNLEDFRRNTIHPNFSPVQSTVTMYENIPYGDHPLENFDIFLPNGQNNCPVVIFIHGGGFNSYSKTEGYGPRTGIDQTWQIHEDAMYFLNQGIAYASINYPLFDLQNPEAGPDIWHIYDRMTYCLQFMKYHSDILRINKDKMILTGISAGSIFSQYVHFGHDKRKPDSSDLIRRESTKPFTIAIRFVHSVEDIEVWQDEVFREYDMDMISFFNGLPNVQKQMALASFKALYHVNSVEEFYDPEVKTRLLEINSLRFIGPHTEEFWMANYFTGQPTNYMHAGHHGNHARYVHEIADAANAPHIIFYGDQSHGNETFRNFIVRKTTESGNRG